MTEHDIDDVRTLFHDAQPAEVPVTRDLIGPAVAWGSARRRRDRLVVGATVGTLMVAALAAFSLRPDSGRGSAPPVPLASTPGTVATSATSSTGPKTRAEVVREEQGWYRDFEALLPAGFHAVCTPPQQIAPCWGPLSLITGPGGSSVAEFGTGAETYPDPPLKGYTEHAATSQIPLTSGVRQVPEGTVTISSLDVEAKGFVTPAMMKNPTARVFHQARYSFTPTGGGPSFHILISELVADIQWQPPASDDNSRAMWGYDPSGPVLSPEQFAKIAADPRFGALLQRHADLADEYDSALP